MAQDFGARGQLNRKLNIWKKAKQRMMKQFDLLMEAGAELEKWINCGHVQERGPLEGNKVRDLDNFVVKEDSVHMKITFVSNYINHHQIPFCNAMCKETKDRFAFIQTQPMEEERIRMGWQEKNQEKYIYYYYEEEAVCKRLIQESDVVLFGGCEDESYIEKRLQEGRPIIRISERLYKMGQWKAISPRGLIKKYHDHTRYRNAPVYLLCAGAYVPSDFHMIKAYPQKMFCWGYFTETKQYDVDRLLAKKGYRQGEQKVPYLLWAGRLIELKHPELALKTAKYLKEQGHVFHMDIVGGGVMEDTMKEMLQEFQLEDCVSLVGFLSPLEVRSRMERADIYLFTSNRIEGWGAVVNESMNSGCAVVAAHMIGSTPYLIRQGYNGYVYQDGNEQMLFDTVEKLVKAPDLCQTLGRHAYETITEVWNAENAAKRLMELIENVVLKGEKAGESQKGLENLYPCAPAPVISERRMWKEMTQ